MDTPSIPFTVALLGAGTVGTAVAELARRAGDRVIAVASRAETSARRAAEFLGAPVASLQGCTRAEVILVGAPDAALTEVDAVLAPAVGSGQVVCHFAGAYGMEPFPEVARAGAAVAALHPVQACPSVEAAIARLPGSAWGVTCSPGLEEWAHAVVSAHLLGTPVPVAELDRPLWHAAAVVTSNGIAALMGVGEEILGAMGIEEPEAVLGPLARGTIQNAIERGGAAATLTGPVVRGDVETVERHVAALRARDAEMAMAYIRASLSILETAVRVRRVDDATAVEMRRRLQ